MNTRFAYLMLDGPGDPAFDLMICVYVPAVSILISWVLSRWKLGRWIATMLAAIATLIVLSLLAHSLTRAAKIEDFGIGYVIAIAVAAGFPTIAAAHFWSLRRNQTPNHSAQPTRQPGG